MGELFHQYREFHRRRPSITAATAQIRLNRRLCGTIAIEVLYLLITLAPLNMEDQRVALKIANCLKKLLEYLR